MALFGLFGGSDNKKSQKIREGIAVPGIFGIDPDDNLGPSQGGTPYFKRLSDNIDRDFSTQEQSRILKTVYWLYEGNPLAKRLVELTRDYVVGGGISYAVDDGSDDVKDVLDAFWHDDINFLDIKLHDKVMELGLYGEQIWPVFVNPVNGHVRLGYIDPANVVTVFKHPLNAEITVALEVRVGGEATALYKTIHRDEEPESETYGLMVGIKTDEAGIAETPPDFVLKNVTGTNRPKTYAGATFFFAVNKVSNATRGRSDLLSVSDWADAFDQVLFNELDRAILLKSFIFDVTLDGATNEELAKYAKENPAPKPGSVRYHNEMVKWQSVSPDLKLADSKVLAELVLGYVATGGGSPKTWLNGLEDSNRATASELGEPAFKHLNTRQIYVRYMITRVINFVLDQASIRGLVSRPSNGMWPVTLIMPEIRPKNLKLAADTFQRIVVSVHQGIEDGVLTPEVAKEIYVLAVSQLGIDVSKADFADFPPPAPPTPKVLPGVVPSTNGTNGRVDKVV